MALELATQLEYQDEEPGSKRERYEEGTPLSKLPKAAQAIAKEQDILRVHVTQPGEMDFEELYQRAVDVGVINVTADELEAAVRAQEQVRALAVGFGAPTPGPQATDIPAGDGGGFAAKPLELKEEAEAAGLESFDEGESESDRPSGNASKADWVAYWAGEGKDEAELEGMTRDELRDL